MTRWNSPVRRAGPGYGCLLAVLAFLVTLILLACVPARVHRIVDGDTIDTSAGRVRLIGIDTPERGQPCFSTASAWLNILVGRTVVLSLPAGHDNTDRYGRLLRYVVWNGIDWGESQVRENYANPRYDGLDGYDPHPKQALYRSLGAAQPGISC